MYTKTSTRLTMPPPLSPCKDCTDRHRNCHSECIRYISFKEDRMAIHDKLYQAYITQVKLEDSEARKSFKAKMRRNKYR